MPIAIGHRADVFVGVIALRGAYVVEIGATGEVARGVVGESARLGIAARFRTRSCRGH